MQAWKAERPSRIRDGDHPACPAAPCVRPAWARTKWGSSPLCDETMRRSTSRSQGREGDRASGGRLCESHKPMNKNHIRGRRGLVSWHNTAKPFVSAPEVNGVVVWRRSAFLPGEICPTWRPGLGQGALRPAMVGVIGQKSAEIIVVGPTSRGCERPPAETAKPEVSAR